ncbi:rhodanese-like domain-containing protein [Adlercreutzia sp. R7]|uniref:Rhodanese-like domain-containing protein n=1 Tax=Adlercreutzia wanghongyangiae TaxID=3111451 RepID=A0ABU6IKN7_9ACTN|nr:rhodanese-like domain-containing protein [Adlercreutzia sp. R7]
MRAYKIVDADYVKREIGRVPLVDVRPPLYYNTGHIPTAVNIRLDVAAAAADPSESLAEMFQDNGIFPEDGVIVYCQSGIHAKIACDYLVQAGYSQLYLYAGSMNDWTSDPARPVERTDRAFARAS